MYIHCVSARTNVSLDVCVKSFLQHNDVRFNRGSIFYAISLCCRFRTFKNGFYTLTDMSGKATQLQPVKNPVQARGPPATYTVIATTTTDSIPKAATNPGLPARERLQK